MRNGPSAVDFGKAGPRVVLKLGPDSYRMWYEALGANSVTTIAHAVSTDGVNWTKQGTVMSPAGAASWERDEVSPGTIVVENGVYKLWYHGGGFFVPGSSNRNGAARIGYATSTDGLSWTKHPSNPVLDIGASGAFDAEQVAEPRVLRVASGYRMYFTGANVGSQLKSLGLAFSSDGIVWSKDGRSPILDSGRWGGFWGGAFILENGFWHLWHGFDTGGGQIRYKWSLDGIAWNDGPQTPVLTTANTLNGPDTTFLGDSVSGYRDGDEYRIFYTGFAANLFGTDGRFEGINMARVAATCP